MIARCVALALLSLVSGCGIEIEPRGPSPFRERVTSSLLANKYFIPAQVEVPEVIFYCVCGAYTVCDRPSKELADKLGYERPPHKFRFLGEEQEIMFFRGGEVTVINIPDIDARFSIAEPHQAYCSTNMTLQVPHRNADGAILDPPLPPEP